jgi:hypothetical protein
MAKRSFQQEVLVRQCVDDLDQSIKMGIGHIFTPLAKEMVCVTKKWGEWGVKLPDLANKNSFCA